MQHSKYASATGALSATLNRKLSGVPYVHVWVASTGSANFYVYGARNETDWRYLDTITLTDSPTLVENCEDVWDEYVQANVTATADATHKIAGSFAAKLAVGADAAVGLLATEAIGSTDISAKSHLRVWVYSSIDLAAGDLAVVLDDTALCASPLEELLLPAIAADTGEYVILPLQDKAADTAIISVGVKMLVDKGAFDLWVDDINAITHGSLNNYTNMFQHIKVATYAAGQNEIEILG